MTTVTVTKTTCDICLNSVKYSDERADIVFGFWIHAEGVDACSACVQVIERAADIFAEALNAIDAKRAKLKKEYKGAWKLEE